MRYEWDEAKRQENIRKHEVDFADAVGALEDPFGLTRDDPTAEGEPRFVTLGRGFSDRFYTWYGRSVARMSRALFPRARQVPVKRVSMRNRP